VFFFHFFGGVSFQPEIILLGGPFTLSSVGGSSLKGAEGADQKNAATLQTSTTFAPMKLGASGRHLPASLA